MLVRPQRVRVRKKGLHYLKNDMLFVWQCFFLSNAKKEYFAYRLLSMCVEKKIGYAHTCVTLLHMRITDQRSLCVVVPKSSTPFITNSRERRDPPKYVHTYDVGIRIIGTKDGIWPYV